jgi:hypothetical protein
MHLEGNMPTAQSNHEPKDVNIHARQIVEKASEDLDGGRIGGRRVAAWPEGSDYPAPTVYGGKFLPQCELQRKWQQTANHAFSRFALI